jgi:anti-sigma factor ChrR (cupin superfamily)
MAISEGTQVIQGLFDADKLIAERDWKPLHKGVEISVLYQNGQDGPMAAFLHYQPGARVPAHYHPGYEHILILSGQQRDEQHVYDAGTLAIQSPGMTHAITSEKGCLALAIWAKPVVLCS